MNVNALRGLLGGRLYGIPRNLDIEDGVTVATFNTQNQITWYRLKEGGTISAIRMFISVSNGNLSVGVARNTGRGTSAQPGTLLATSGSTASPGTGTRDISLGSTVTVRAGDWVGIATDSATLSLRAKTTGTPQDTTLAAGQCYRETPTSGITFDAARQTLTAQTPRGHILVGV